VVVEACKQCGRNRLARIDEPRTFEGLLDLAGNHDRALLATTAEGARGLTEALKGTLRGGQILLAIGPEGGFAPTEIEAARGAGFLPVTLGRPRLRVATAAVAGVAAILALTEPASRS
jgi:16S rRNA (uracil1498-N3)-methyltransferase